MEARRQAELEARRQREVDHHMMLEQQKRRAEEQREMARCARCAVDSHLLTAHANVK